MLRPALGKHRKAFYLSTRASASIGVSLNVTIKKAVHIITHRTLPRRQCTYTDAGPRFSRSKAVEMNCTPCRICAFDTVSGLGFRV